MRERVARDELPLLSLLQAEPLQVQSSHLSFQEYFAACALRDGTALAEVRRRVANDQLPLLSLLQTEPLQLQSSHLSFQEYFAARALCEEGTVLSGAPPWQWPVWWSNALAIGEGMGDKFGKGLLRAAGVTGGALDLSWTLAGDLPTACKAVAQLAAGLTSLK